MKKILVILLILLGWFTLACGEPAEDEKENGNGSNGDKDIDTPSNGDDTNDSVNPELTGIFQTLQETENFTLTFTTHFHDEHQWEVIAQVDGEIIYIEDEFYGVWKEQYFVVEEGNTVSYTRYTTEQPWLRDREAGNPEFNPNFGFNLDAEWFTLEGDNYLLKSEYYRNFERFIMIDDIVSVTLTIVNGTLQFDISSILDLHGAEYDIATSMAFTNIGTTVINLPSFSNYIDDDDD